MALAQTEISILPVQGGGHGTSCCRGGGGRRRDHGPVLPGPAPPPAAGASPDALPCPRPCPQRDGTEPPPAARTKASEGERAPATHSAMLEPHETTVCLPEKPPCEAAQAIFRRTEDGDTDGQRESSYDAVMDSGLSPGQPSVAGELGLQQNALPGPTHRLHFGRTNFIPVTLLLHFPLKYSSAPSRQHPVPAARSQPQGVPPAGSHRPTPRPRGCRLYPVLTRLCCSCSNLCLLWFSQVCLTLNGSVCSFGPPHCRAGVPASLRCPGRVLRYPQYILSHIPLTAVFLERFVSSSVEASQWPFPNKTEFSGQTPLALCQAPVSPASESRRLPVIKFTSSH